VCAPTATKGLEISARTSSQDKNSPGFAVHPASSFAERSDRLKFSQSLPESVCLRQISENADSLSHGVFAETVISGKFDIAGILIEGTEVTNSWKQYHHGSTVRSIKPVVM
jgi:hypothetical protein